MDVPLDPQDPVSPSDADPLSLWLAERLAGLLTECGVPVRQQAALLTQLCGLSISQARRKFRGAPWSFGEVLAVARHCGVSLDNLVAGQPAPGVVQAPPTRGGGVSMQPARFVAAGWNCPCEVRLGALLSGRIPKGTLVAVRHQGGWLAGARADLAQEGAEAPWYRADQVALTPPPAKAATRIAVLDDEAGTSETLCEWFDAMGYEARPFSSAAQLRAASPEGFDAFVIDFVLSGGESSETVIEEIRHVLPEAPILLLTGKLRSGLASEVALATVLRTAKVQFFEKPVRPAVLAAAIEARLDQAVRRP